MGRTECIVVRHVSDGVQLRLLGMLIRRNCSISDSDSSKVGKMLLLLLGVSATDGFATLNRSWTFVRHQNIFVFRPFGRERSSGCPRIDIRRTRREGIRPTGHGSSTWSASPAPVGIVAHSVGRTFGRRFLRTKSLIKKY